MVQTSRCVYCSMVGPGFGGDAGDPAVLVLGAWAQEGLSSKSFTSAVVLSLAMFGGFAEPHFLQHCD